MNFSEEIIEWYGRNKRDLPWRHTRDPYILWLSEVIMQQTRVAQGTPYFLRFAEKYPSVSDLASATEDEVLKLWQGLGYYSRGRNMHQAARMVMEVHEGYFPANYEALRKLKGVGDYTAAAVSSFASNESKAVVDGNVLRLLARYFGIHTPINSSKGKTIFSELANSLIHPSQPGTYNQAIMEFGSLQCKPRKPDCPSCPLFADCFARKENMQNELPVKIKAKKVRTRYFNYFLARADNQIAVHKRGPKDIWENLYELPLIETDSALDASQLCSDLKFIETFGRSASVRLIFGPVNHVLSHQKIHASFFTIENFSEHRFKENGWTRVSETDLEKLAQPKLIFEFFKSFYKLTDGLNR